MLFECKSAGHYRQRASDRRDGLFVGDLRGTGRVCTHIFKGCGRETCKVQT